MHRLKKFKFELFIGLLLSAIYFFLRMYQLKNLPIFSDEAIYAHWAQMGMHNSAYRLISLNDGKQPLFIWMISLLINVISNPLATGRVVSILAGFLTLFALYFLSLELFKSRKIAFVSAAMYVFYPFAVLVNRFAIYESMVGLFDVLSLYAAVILIRKIDTARMFVLANILAASILTKSTGFFNIYFLPIILLFAKSKKQILQFVIFAGVAVIFTHIYYSVTLLGPDDGITVGARNTVFLYSIGDLTTRGAISQVPKHLIEYFGWLVEYLSVLAIIPLFLAFINKKYRIELIVLFLWFALKFMVFAVFGKLVFPRYIFPISLTLLPIIAFGIFELKNRIKFARITVISLSLIFLPMLFSDVKILTDLPRAPIPEIDRYQYANGWPAGGGVREIVNYLQSLAAKEKIFVVVEGGYTYGGFPASAFNVYFQDNPNFEKIEVNDDPFILPKGVLELSKIKPVYVVFNRIQDIPKFPMDLIAQYQKGVGDSYIRLYKLNPSK